MPDSAPVNSTACVSCKQGKVPWTDFIGEIARYAQGASDAFMADAARTAAIEFCRRTEVLTSTVCIDAQACVNHYSLEFDDCYTVKSVCRVCVNGRELEGLNKFPHCPTGCSFYYEHPCDLYVYPAPNCDADNAIEVDVVLVPSRDTCFADMRLREEYAEAIAHGALERLLMIPNTDWYDPGSAGLYAQKFRRAIAQTKVDVARGGQSGPQYARPSQCFMP